MKKEELETAKVGKQSPFILSAVLLPTSYNMVAREC